MFVAELKGEEVIPPEVGGYVLNDAGVMLSGYDGKREAYDLAPLVGVRFEERLLDGNGRNWMELDDSHGLMCYF